LALAPENYPKKPIFIHFSHEKYKGLFLKSKYKEKIRKYSDDDSIEIEGYEKEDDKKKQEVRPPEVLKIIRMCPPGKTNFFFSCNLM